MLVLQRKRGEALLVGDDVRIVVLAVGQTSVKLGIDAPRSTMVVREELLAPVIDAAAAVPGDDGGAS